MHMTSGQMEITERDLCAIPSRWRGKTAVSTPTQETDAVAMQKRSRAGCRKSQALATLTAAETCRRLRNRANAASKQEVADANANTLHR